MNKIQKYLKKLPTRELTGVLEVIDQIIAGHISGLDIKKLRGFENRFRARKGKTRIIFHFDVNGTPVIDEVVRRDDNTY